MWIRSNDMAPMIALRPLIPSDEPFLWEMLYQALYVPPGQPPLSRDLIQSPELRPYVEGWGGLSDIGWLALDDEIPVGAVWFRLLVGTNRGYGYVDDTTPELSIAVLPEYRGQGIGTMLLRQLLELSPLPYSAISLSVDAENPARRL